MANQEELKIKVRLDSKQAEDSYADLKKRYDNAKFKLTVVVDDKEYKAYQKALDTSKKQDKLKISTSVDQKEFDRFAKDFTKLSKNVDSKLNIGIKVTGTKDIENIQKKVDEFRRSTSQEMNVRFNVKQDSNIFNQIKKNIADIKAIEKIQLTIKFAEIGLDTIKTSLNALKGVTSTLFDGLKLNNSFEINKVGLENSLLNQGLSPEQARLQALLIQSKTRQFTELSPFTAQEGFQASGTLKNAGFNVLAGADTGSINEAKYGNILNIVSDLASRQKVFLGKTSGEALADATRAIVELQGGQTVSLKSRFNVNNTQIEDAVNRAGLRDKVDFETKNGELQLIKKSLTDLNTEDLTKFFGEISKLTNSQGLSEKLANRNDGLLSTITEKLQGKITSFFGDESDLNSLAGKLNTTFKRIVDYLNSADSELFTNKLKEFGQRLGAFIEQSLTTENLNKFGKGLSDFADFVSSAFSKENSTKITDGVNGIAEFVGGKNGSRSGANKITDGATGAGVGALSFFQNPVAGLVSTSLGGYFGSQVNKESGVGAGLGGIAGGIGGALVGGSQGALAGAAIGSVVPVIGTAVGGAIGGTVGAIGGSGLGAGLGGVVGGGTGSLFNEETRKKIEEFTTKTVPKYFEDLGKTLNTWFVDRAKDAQNWITDTTTPVSNFFTRTIPDNFNGGKNTIQNWFNERVNDANNWIENTKTSVSNFFNQNWGQILLDASTKFGEFVGSSARAIVDFATITLPENAQKMFDAIEKFGTDAGKAIEKFINDAGTFINSIPATVDNAFIQANNFANDKLEQLSNFANQKVNEIGQFFNALPGKINSEFEKGKKFASDRLNDIEAFSKQLPDKIANGISGIADKIGEEFKKGWEQATAWVGKIGEEANKATNAIGQKSKEITDYAGQVKDNFLSGLASGFSGNRAEGGFVGVGGHYRVNELGREIFVGQSGQSELLDGNFLRPQENGFVIPRDITSQIMGAIQPKQGNTINLNNTFPAQSGNINMDLLINKLLNSLAI